MYYGQCPLSYSHWLYEIGVPELVGNGIMSRGTIGNANRRGFREDLKLGKDLTQSADFFGRIVDGREGCTKVPHCPDYERNIFPFL